MLELEILRASKPNDNEQLNLYLHQVLQLNVDQFYGIEIEEFPAQIAQVALWLMDHQMNQLVSEEFGLYFARIPLQASSTIVCANALQINWKTVISPWHTSYILGNPPFVGAKYMNEDQRKDVSIVFDGIKNAGLLDYVAAWYVKAIHFMKGENIRCAFVSTNSITQGEQVGVLWGWMLKQGIKIFFAHRTFQWNNEARGKAAVHCVIIGFADSDISPKWLFEYENIKGEPQKIKAQNINPYLIDAPNVIIENRKFPICKAHELSFGNMPNDGGHLLLDKPAKDILLQEEPSAKNWINTFMGADELINGYQRWCLWLVNAKPQELKSMPFVLKRIEKVRENRLSSKRDATKKLAASPSLFGEIRQPKSLYIAIPKTSSEKRTYIPLKLLEPDTIANSELFTIDNSDFYTFGILMSLMHNSWLRTVCGRLKSDYRYSAGIVYNNFPWPENPTEKQKQTIKTAVQAVLDARAKFHDSSLADLYDPLTMPPVLLKAHQTLDRMVDAAYGKTNFKTEAERVAFLFELYLKYTNLFAREKPKRKKPSSIDKGVSTLSISNHE